MAACNYAEDVIHGRWPEGEALIATDANSSVQYATEVLHGRFPAGEPAIVTNQDYRAEYVYLLRLHDPEGLAEFQLEYGDWAPDKVTEAGAYYTAAQSLQSPARAFTYADKVIKGRWPEGEKVILRHAYWAGRYAAEVLHARWPEAEAVILAAVKSVGDNARNDVICYDARDDAVCYAHDVIHGRWPEVEAYILTNPDSAVGYARKIIGGRWLAGEKSILSNKETTEDYLTVLQDLDPEGLAEFELEHGDWVPDKIAETALAKVRSRRHHLLARPR